MLWQTQPEAEKLAHQGIVDPPSAISRTQIPVFSLGLPGSKVVGFDLKLKSSSVLLMHICRVWCSLNLLEIYLLSPIMSNHSRQCGNSMEFNGIQWYNFQAPPTFGLIHGWSTGISPCLRRRPELPETLSGVALAYGMGLVTMPWVQLWSCTGKYRICVYIHDI